MKPANSNLHSPMRLFSLVPISLALCFLVGCATNSAVLRVNQPDRSLLVVPVKGQPIMVRSLHTATFVLGGIAGGQIEQAMATGSSASLCARLNQDTTFNGERILAEECGKLLRTSTKCAFHEVTIHPQDAAMPLTKDMEPTEQKRFKVNCPNIHKWGMNYDAWKAGPPAAGTLPSRGQRPVCLEATIFAIFLNHGSELQGTSIWMRVIDPETGEVVGFTGLIDSFDITKVTETSDLRTFESDFRKVMHEVASKLLCDLNLL